MSTKNHPKRKTAISRIYSASQHVALGNADKAESHLKEAHAAAGDYLKHLTVHEHHDHAVTESKKFKFYFDKLDNHIATIRNKMKKSESEDLEKNFMDEKKYSYKPFHELAPQDQNKARIAFQGKDLESHFYPTEHGSGDLAHAARYLPPKASNLVPGSPTKGRPTRPPVANEAQAKKPATANTLQPHHLPDASVRIHSEGHANHGSLGLVQLPNPLHPGKIAVKVTDKPGSGVGMKTIFVEPHHVRPSKPSPAKPLAKNVISETKQLMERIKSRKKA